MSKFVCLERRERKGRSENTWKNEGQTRGKTKRVSEMSKFRTILQTNRKGNCVFLYLYNAFIVPLPSYLGEKRHYCKTRFPLPKF